MNQSEHATPITIPASGEVTVAGRTIQLSPMFAGHALHRVGEKRFAVVSADEVIEFYVDLNVLSDDELLIPEWKVLRPVEEGEDRLRFARHFLESRTVEGVKDMMTQRLGRDVGSICEEDWTRLTRVANKWGSERLVKYFSDFLKVRDPSAPDSLGDAIFYLLEVPPNPRFALQRVEACGL
jgi:hypothetical protein